ncbi:MAG: YfcE family phosphodiesterase [Dehalococcoidales bacterium]|nr:YfcE family phosphodiesterase [Dehalococcoidales bacterium]
MRIGLLSDTHIPEAETELPRELLTAFQGVDLILHAGDIYVRSVLDELARIAPVLAARGDDDYGSTLTDERVKEKHILNLEGRKVWLVHQRPYYLTTSWWRDQHTADQPKDDHPDIVVFGHEHRTVVENDYDILFVSPGSPTFLHYLRGLGTIGIMEIKDGKVDVNIVRL